MLKRFTSSETGRIPQIANTNEAPLSSTSFSCSLLHWVATNIQIAFISIIFQGTVVLKKLLQMCLVMQTFGLRETHEAVSQNIEDL